MSRTQSQLRAIPVVQKNKLRVTVGAVAGNDNERVIAQLCWIMMFPESFNGATSL